MSPYRSSADETDRVDSGAQASGADALSSFLPEVGISECTSSREQRTGERLRDSDAGNKESRSEQQTAARKSVNHQPVAQPTIDRFLKNIEERFTALTTIVEQLTPTVATFQHRLDAVTLEVNRLNEAARSLESRLVTLTAALTVPKEERDRIGRRPDALETAVTRRATALEIENGHQPTASSGPEQVSIELAVVARPVVNPEPPLLIRSLRVLTPEWKWTARHRIPALAVIAAILVGSLLLRPMRGTTVSGQTSIMPPAPAPMVTKPGEVALNTAATVVAAPVEHTTVHRVPVKPPAIRFVGTLSVQSEPSNAVVFVNQQRVGTTPLQLPRLPAGSYAIWVEHESYQRWTAAVLVPAHKLTRVTVKLEPTAAQ
jgi:hypothetical protein